MTATTINLAERAQQRSESAQTVPKRRSLRNIAFKIVVARGYTLYLAHIGSTFKLCGRDMSPKQFRDLKYKAGKYAMDFNLALRRAETEEEVREALRSHVDMLWEQI